MRLTCEPTDERPARERNLLRDARPSVDWFCDCADELRRAVGQRDRIDAVVQVRGIAA